MNKTQYLQFAEGELQRVLSIVRQKNSDYTGGTQCGDPFANFTISEDFGVDPITGLCIRMADKFQRVKTFCRDGKMAQANEGVVDAFRDIIGYSLIALGMLHDVASAVLPENFSPPFEGPVVGFPDIPDEPPHPVAKTKLQLAVGKKYRNRIGDVVTIVRRNTCPTWYPWVGDNDATYTDDGLYLRNYKDCILNLIEEVTDEPQDTNPCPFR